MDKIENYLNELNSEVQVLMKEEKLLPVPAFTQYVTDGIAEKTGVDELYNVHCLIKDRSDRVKGEIYGYGISANKEVLTLYYSIYEPMSKPKSITTEDFDRGINRMKGFYDLCIRGTHIGMNEDLPEYEVMKFVYDNLSSIVTVRLCLLTNYLINKYKIKRLRIDGKNVMADVWDINKICANLNSESDHVSVDIDFVNEDRYKTYQLPYIEMNSERYGYKCLSTMFPAKLLYKLYEDHNTGLLMNNVRFFLGFKRGKDDTNSGMRKTLRERNEMFLAYNNGITAIARGLEVESDKGEMKLENEDGAYTNDFISTGIIKKIFDFQIVNGGQTTATIFNSKKTEKDINLLGVYVMVKLIVIDEGDRNVITDITRYSNTQNKVKFSDYSSNSSFNTEMERLSRKTLIPNSGNEPIFWYYERVMGQYKIELNNRTLKPNQDAFKRMFNPSRKFGKELLAKLWLSWEGSPHSATVGASKCYAAFLASIDDGKYVPDENYFKQSVALLILYKHLYEHAKRNDFGTAKAPVVAYTMAYLNFITLGNIDLLKIWDLQEIPESVAVCLNNLCERMRAELEVSARTASRSVVDIAKKSSLFSEMKNRDLGFDSSRIREIMSYR